MICIYHSRDLDGYTSAAIVKLKYPRIKLLGYDYGQPFPWDDITPGEPIIMVDVSLPMPDMIKLADLSENMTWIDHHISAIKDFNTTVPSGTLKPALNNEISACEGTWVHLFPDKDMPQAVKILGEYDTWRNKDQSRWENVILPFQFGMRVQCQSPETFPINLFEDDSKDVIEIIQYGNVILKYQQQVNKKQCERAFEYPFAGLRAICHNAGGFNSDLFKSIYDPNKHDIMLMFQYDGKNHTWIVSLYSDKPQVDCSLIAKVMGGGGHKGAAGFQADSLRTIFNGTPEGHVIGF